MKIVDGWLLNYLELELFFKNFFESSKYLELNKRNT